MKSYVTAAFDSDPIVVGEKISKEIFENFVFERNAVGILFCDPEIDISRLLGYLEDKFTFDIMGCSAAEIFAMRECGHVPTAVFTVLSSDECEFRVHVEKVDVDPEPGIEKLCKRLKNDVSGNPDCVLALLPYKSDMIIEDFTDAFGKHLGGVPVFGAVASMLSDAGAPVTFAGGQIYSDAPVLLSFKGGADPVYRVRNIRGNIVSDKKTVTRSEGNVIYTADDVRFLDHLMRLGIPEAHLSGPKAEATFLSNPILVEIRGDNGPVSYLRAMREINFQDGSCTVSGRVPEGAKISVTTLKREEIEESVRLTTRELVDAILQKETETGREYTTVFAISCMGRRLAMLPKVEAEIKALRCELPERIKLTGFYALGELGPLKNPDTVCFAHNESLVLFAI